MKLTQKTQKTKKNLRNGKGGVHPAVLVGTQTQNPRSQAHQTHGTLVKNHETLLKKHKKQKKT